VPLLVGVGVAAALVLGSARDGALRTAALVGGLGVLAIGPAIWALDTLGHATSGTFPEGGPQSALTAGGGPGGFGGPGGGARGGGVPGFGGHGGASSGGAPIPGGAGVGAPGGSPAVGSRSGGGVPLFGGGGGSGSGSAGSARIGGPGGGGALGAPLGNAQNTTRALAYAKAHGGGTVAVESQSSAASEIVSGDAEVAGIGGFSGRESDVSVSWLAEEVAKGKIRWVLSEGASTGGPRLAGDTRAGSRTAMAAAAMVCEKVTLGQSRGTSGTGGEGESGLYDCQGRAAQLANA
jgi:hypothetical protein